MKKSTVCKTMALIMLSAAVLTGCSAPAKSSNVSSESEPASAAAASSSSAPEESAPADDAGEEIDPETMDFIKYNIYVEMNNYIIEVLDNIQNYYTVVADEEEFSLLPDSGYTYGFGIRGLNSDIIDDALAVASMEPAYDTLDALTGQLAEPMRTLMDTFSEISSSNDFADNQYAKAKEFHTAIHGIVDSFVEPAYQFLDDLTVIANERVENEEAAMKENGELIAYNSSHAITVANKIMDECFAQGVDDYNLTELDLTAIQPLYDELVATVEDYKAAVADNDQLVKESLSNSSPFDGLFDSLVQSVEWVFKQVESQTPLDDPSMESLGSLNHVGVVLSDCIDRYNSVFAE